VKKHLKKKNLNTLPVSSAPVNIVQSSKMIYNSC